MSIEQLEKVSVLVAQLGARRHYAVPRALYAAGLLEGFMTDACASITPWRWLDVALPSRARPEMLQRLLDRQVNDIPPCLIHDFPWFAVSTAWKNSAVGAQSDRWAQRNAAFGELVVHAGFGKANTVYAFNGAALEMFRAARNQGVTTVLDQTAAPWRSISELLSEEVERWPGWEDAPAEVDVSGHLTAREEEEWTLADRIVCGSDFVASALAECGGPENRCAIAPYSAPLTSTLSALKRPPRSKPERPLRALFAGTLQLRKGVQYLLEAKRQLRTAPIVFRLVGPSRFSDHVMSELDREMELVGPAARSEMANHYVWADVFVLPTLSEGSANVCYEAMAAGLPIITTPNAGSVIRDCLDGYVVPVRDPQAISDRLDRLASDPDLLAAMSREATRRASDFTIGRYGERLIAAIMPIAASADC